ncbi:hypothetical protein [Pseudomonas oryzihabitans]|uniref:hypothetical protein n=1 Tax=Pseudomonas oryzihabitans TaxID=47885 RepID=UPI0011A4ABF9|nr:hypothetical protein [Pseudomonas psychrotolerans]
MKNTTSNTAPQLETVSVSFMDIPSGHAALCVMENIPVSEVMARVEGALNGAFQLLRRIADDDNEEGRNATSCEVEALGFLIETAAAMQTSCRRAIDRAEGVK